MEKLAVKLRVSQNRVRWMLQMNWRAKADKGISVVVTMLFCLALVAPVQSAELWKALFDGKDFSGWTVTARGGGAALDPVAAGWKFENGVIVGGQAGPGQKGGTLASKAQFKDFELELDFMIAEQPAARTAHAPTARTIAASICGTVIR